MSQNAHDFNFDECVLCQFAILSEKPSYFLSANDNIIVISVILSYGQTLC